MIKKRKNKCVFTFWGFATFLFGEKAGQLPNIGENTGRKICSIQTCDLSALLESMRGVSILDLGILKSLYSRKLLIKIDNRYLLN